MTSTRQESTVKLVRCAVYTRKSTEEELDQEFNSLDAQRDAGEAYVRSQTGEGWVALPDRYDDGGFTGGNTDRPGLRRLMADVKAGRVDCVVVYKVDRLSRSLLDFAQLMQRFEQKGVSFVSVTQQFNTASSMGSARFSPDDDNGDVGRRLADLHDEQRLAEDRLRRVRDQALGVKAATLSMANAVVVGRARHRHFRHVRSRVSSQVTGFLA